MDGIVRRKRAAASIRWASHKGSCLDVGGGEPLNGSAIQIWACDQDHPDMRFLLPEGGRGQVRWAKFPQMCLDVADGADGEGARLQVWTCQDGHPDMEFVLPDGRGEIRWAGSPDGTTEKCLDVRGGHLDLGTHVQLWTCVGNAQANQQFEVTWDDRSAN
uniref:Ricin B lectin domain-containing protein n=1 Tax=Zooxanthella nutricula TaxID=1333877 RepID=A0A7S2VKX3_9DINO